MTTQTVEAARFCLGDEDAGGTCVSDWDNVSLYWTRDGSTLHPIAGSDRVGIGTADADARLHVVGTPIQGSPTTEGIQMGSDGTSYGIEITSDGSTPYIDFQNDTGGTDYDMRLILTSSNDLKFQGGDVTVAGDFVASDDIYLNDKLYHENDTNTYIDFNSDAIKTFAGGVRFVDIIEGSSDVLVVNEDGADVDFRVEGDTDANLLFTNASSDRVGIGTASPSYKLDVNGTANATQLCLNGSCISSWSSSGAQGSGTTNYVAKWTSATTLGDSAIFDSGGTVGIGTTAPTETVTIARSYLSGLFKGLGIGEDPAVSTNRHALFSYYDAGSDNNSYLRIVGKANGGDHLVVKGSGTVGINTSAPSARLQVVAGTNKEGIRVIASNYSPFVIRDSADASDVFRIDENSQASGSAFIAGTSTPTDVSKIPILNINGKIDQTLLPFKKGDLIAPSDRPTVEGASGDSYTADYFRIDRLNIDIATQSSDQVCSDT